MLIDDKNISLKFIHIFIIRFTNSMVHFGNILITNIGLFSILIDFVNIIEINTDENKFAIYKM